jgi:hypothetical protein
MVKLRTDHHLSWLNNKADFLGYGLLHFLLSLTSGYLCMGYLHNLGAVSLFLSPLIFFFPIESYICKDYLIAQLYMICYFNTIDSCGKS